MDNLILDLFNKKIIIINNEDLSINFDILVSYPYIINNIVKFIYDKIKMLEYTNIIGLNTCSHIASILSYNHNIPILFLNKNNLVKGIYDDDNNIILFTDVIDNESKLIKYMSILNSNKLNIKYIFTIYDKNNSTKIDNVISLFDYNYLTHLLVSKNIIKDYFITKPLLKKIKQITFIKKSKICYDCNLTNIKDIITDVDNIGKYIVMLKICSNNIIQFNPNYGNALKKLATNHNFIIIDDLGIYDTKHINLSNYNWCDIITTYNQYLKAPIELIYINNNFTNITTNILGIMGNITNGNYLQLSNTIDNIESLKTNINKYDIISIRNSFCNDKIINYINSKL
jgi:hypothetical protein